MWCKRLMRRYRLAAVMSHPIQYQVPLLRKLARHPQIDLMVYFGSEGGAKVQYDPELGIARQWDIPLLDGYPYKILRNYSLRPSVSHFGGLINSGILQELRKGNYDAVFVHGWGHATSWLAFFGTWMARTPFLMVRGEATLLYPRPLWQGMGKRVLLRFLFRRIGAFLAIGTFNTQFYRTYGVPAEQIFLVPYAVDNEFFMKGAEVWRPRRNEIREELGVPRDVPIVLYSGKLIERKRPMDLLRAFQQVSGGEKAALVFVGEGNQRPLLEAYAKAAGLSSVLFTGFKNQTELPPFYAVADIFVLPSVHDPWGTVVNEAMCFGLPVITTDLVGASGDLVRDNENGFVYKAADVTALARHLQVLIQDPGKRLAMGRRSLEMISTWTYDVGVEGILNALEFVCGEARQKVAA